MTGKPANIKLSSQRDPAEALADAFSKATRRIDAVVYKFSEPKIFDALVAAADGDDEVVVRLVVDRKLIDEKRGKLVRQLLNHGGNIKIRKWPGHKMHAKFVIIDQQHVFAGSYNWTEASRRNTELLLEFTDSESIEHFTGLFDGIWKGANKL